MNKEIERISQESSPVYGSYEKSGNMIKDGYRWLKNAVGVFFYKLGFVIAVEGLSKSGVAVLAWPALNGMIIYFFIKFLDTGKEKIVDVYPLGLVIFIEAMILFWWFNKSTAKKFILDYVGPALKDLASAFKR